MNHISIADFLCMHRAKAYPQKNYIIDTFISHRMLYVDGIVVAEDTQDSLEVSEKRLYIGTGKAMKSGTYWSGLIDDVRIYNRAVKP